MDMQGLDVAALLSAPDIMTFKKIVCIQPHPDDNEIGMGGIIAVLAKNGCEVHYLNVTNGDQGNRHPEALPEQTAAVRKKETELAGRYLGATHFHYLDHGDGTLSDVLSLSIEIAGVLREVKPDGVFCPDPFLPYEGHWDHIVTGRAVANAAHMCGRARMPDGSETKPFTLSGIGYYFTSNPNTIIDITDVFDKKFSAIALHESQMDETLLSMYRFYFTMKGQELAKGKGFSLGEGIKLLSILHTHCFPDALNIG